ncbi:ribonucleoside-diphosphate reductase [Lacticaseibacillus paracasei]|uniref:ribonucleoside-diphosphate reductase n=1 Tax=Lacticaseibacillus paracasei TaxID=1597 RepID=UPI001063AC37|nr:ribonucleoside-diphosphate reductase [Lacticaseibacillus paracasei]TEA91092.1 ribonucleoside-diphosphate reductase [Lacticaseibacillus paracasei]TEA93449.1 ribonucleoside-diphosphate reductase [Lacticaseibacillus paracasei]
MSNGMKRVEYGYVSNVEQAIIEKLSREEKHMQAIIYTKPHCHKCWRTVYKLSRVMPVQTVTADADDYERFRKLGYRSMPVVTIYKANGVHDRWCDLRVDKIKQYTEGKS